ncbi:MAG: DUF2236 domain-containing protein [Chitinophagales bacterium]|nr:DUF2236 domain-containing protein [Chitinophagales bacterium]MCZ2393460.1 DUF2236 domain-containing protein [Chitinophagales bacterium]
MTNFQHQFHLFWSKGNGHGFQSWAKGNLSIKNMEYLDKYYFKIDDECDEIITICQENQSFGSISKFLYSNGQLDALPQEVLSLFYKMKSKPNWLNESLIQKGGELSERCGLIGLLVLRDFSLMGGYYFSNLTQPLIATGALKKGATQRLYNTLNFWINTSRKEIEDNDKRLESCLKIRLIHSISRLAILKKHPDWPISSLGTPINILDMIATKCAFSLYFLYGLRQLNFQFTQEEEDGVFHLWKYNTWLLGVDASLIPDNKKQAVEFLYYWTSKQALPDNNSIILANSLVNENTPLSLFKLDFISDNMDYIHKSVSNYLLDRHILSSLKIPTVKYNHFFPSVLKIQNILIHHLMDRNKQIKRGDLEQKSVLKDYEQHK